MNPQALHKLIEAQGPEALFRTEEGRKYIGQALNALRFGARCSAATVRFPEIRDDLPPPIRQDILVQAAQLNEFIGRCDLMMLLIEETDPIRKPNAWKMFTGIFATIYDEACNREGGLRNLCQLTIDTYKQGKYVDTSRVIDKDF